MPSSAFCCDAEGGGGWVGWGTWGPVRAGTSSGSSSSYEPPEISEPGRSPQAGSRPNLKSEPVGATSTRGSSSWSPRPGRGGGKGSDRVGLGAPGPEHPAWPQDLSVLVWLWVGPGATGLERTGPDYVCFLLSTAPRLPPGQAQQPACSEVGKSFGFLPPGLVHLPAWAGVGVGLSLNRATTCPAVCPQTTACPL